MNFAAILAGGVGSRMDNPTLPKQFICIGGSPIILHTIDRFLGVEEIDKIFIGINSEWSDYLSELISSNYGYTDKIVVLDGGKNRNSTLKNVISEIYSHFGSDGDHIILTHDAVRPFVTKEIIRDNLDSVKQFRACTTAVMATDTILHCPDKSKVSNVLDRNEIFQAQTPQSFSIDLLNECLNKLTDDELDLLTDGTGVLMKFGYDVNIVKGSSSNIKITTPDDLIIAEALIKQL